MKRFLLLVVLIIVVLAAEGHSKGRRGGWRGNKKGKGGSRGGDRRGWKGKMTCEQITKKCDESSNRNRRSWNKGFWGKQDKSNYQGESHQICGNVNGTYSTYNKSFCSMKKAQVCHNMTIVHYGMCGNCTEANVCPLKAKLAGLEKKLEEAVSSRKMKYIQRQIEKLGNMTEKKICTVGGDEEMTMCEFQILKCNAAKNEDELPVKKIACNCDDEASVCPWLKKMKDDLESMKENLNGTSGRWRKRNLERRIRYKTNDINKKQCYCDHKIKMCKAQEAGEEMPEKPDCKNKKSEKEEEEKENEEKNEEDPNVQES